MLQLALTSVASFAYFYRSWYNRKSELSRHAFCAQNRTKVAELVAQVKAFDRLVYEILVDRNESEENLNKKLERLEDELQRLVTFSVKMFT